MPDQAAPPSFPRFIQAAQYLRMSTEHQQFSIANQSAAIALYAAAHNIGIVRSFSDEGKSGRTIKGRTALQQLLQTVQSGAADFEAILVYDVSRFGRFPDVDEAAHYEYLCRRAGIAIHYCAEQFENDNSTTSNLLKALKRTMAGEYSRELSAKVFAGQCRLALSGIWLGGPAPFGMVRQLISKDGKPKQILKLGERKSLATDRVILKPGAKEEVKIVRLIFDLYTEKRMCQEAITTYLNQNRLFRGGRPWHRGSLHSVLTNPVYKGSSAFGKHDCKKIQKKVNNPPDKWIVRDSAFPAIISAKQFARAQELIAVRAKRLTNSDMLAALKRLWERKGTLNSKLIDRSRNVPSTCAFVKHFGLLSKAYDLIGFPHRNSTFVLDRQFGRALRDQLSDEICHRVRASDGAAERSAPSGTLLINGFLTVEVNISVGSIWRESHTWWRLTIKPQRETDVLILARVESGQQSILDYYMIPRLAGIYGTFVVRAAKNVAFLDIHRVKSLEAFVKVLRCCRIPEGA